MDTDLTILFCTDLYAMNHVFGFNLSVTFSLIDELILLQIEPFILSLTEFPNIIII